MTTLTQIAVPFHNAELYLVEHNGQPYTAMRPIVENMGLDWKAQLVKIKQRFSSVVGEITTTGKDGKQYLMLCLPLKKLFGWLMTISPNKVKPELRDTVIKYQEECDDVLWDYWTKGQAINQRHTISPEQQHELHEIVSSRTGSNVAARMEMWTRHNRHFKISKYHQLLAVHFDDAKSYLEKMELKTKIAKDTSLEVTEKPYNIHDFVNRTQHDVMMYVYGLQQQIVDLGGKFSPLPFDDKTIAKGFLGYFLHGKRMMLHFSDYGVNLDLVEHNALMISDTEIAGIISHESRIHKELLPEIIQAAVGRLSK